jgi:hypothetical protein
MGAAALRARLAFITASAITAAALADPLTESLSNAGRFGAGRFTDQSNADVAPALAAGVFFALLFIVALARRMLSGRAAAGSRPRQGAEPPPTPLGALRLFPSIFGLQIGVLFAMETLEQIAVDGHTLGGTIWLGGPIAVSLAIHAVVGIVVALTLARTLQWLARRVVTVITCARRLSIAWPGAPALVFIGAHRAAPRRSIEPALNRQRGRAPPIPAFPN